MAVAVIQSGRFAAPVPPLSVAGCLLWLDPLDASVFTYSSGAVISQWNDKSGNARNVTQATIANQPKRNVTINSVQAVDFDGTDTLSVVTSVPTVLTYMAVIQLTNAAATTGGSLLGTHNTALGADFTARNSTTGVYGGTTVSGGSLVSATPYVLQYTLNGAASSTRINGGANQLPATSPGTYGFASGLRIGGWNSVGDFVGRMGEICVHSGALSLTDINVLGNYLASRYGITWSTAT